MSKIQGFHFHDLEKNATPKRITNYYRDYMNHLKSVFTKELV